MGYGSTFLDRYVSGDLLFLKPLGTFFTIYLSPFFVNAFRVRNHTISTVFMSFISKRLQLMTVYSLWIKRGSYFLFLAY